MKEGDVVRLKAPGDNRQEMTVDTIDDNRMVNCKWVADQRLQEAEFAEADLEVVQASSFFVKQHPTVAGKEIIAWLDYKRVRPAKRAANSDKMSELVQSIMYGDIQINPDKSITHNLTAPLMDKAGAKVVLDKLVYSPRLTAADLIACFDSVQSASNVATTVAYGAALTGQPYDLIAKVDSVDLKIMEAITVFF